MGLHILHEAPSAEEYVALRKAAGMSERNLAAARVALKGSLFAVSIRDDVTNELVAMGRVVGDGGITFQVADIAVQPVWQGKGLGKKIMQEIAGYLSTLDEKAYVSLIADGDARYLYSQFGFVETAPKSVGMMYKPQK